MLLLFIIIQNKLPSSFNIRKDSHIHKMYNDQLIDQQPNFEDEEQFYGELQKFIIQDYTKRLTS